MVEDLLESLFPLPPATDIILAFPSPLTMSMFIRDGAVPTGDFIVQYYRSQNDMLNP